VAPRERANAAVHPGEEQAQVSVIEPQGRVVFRCRNGAAPRAPHGRNGYEVIAVSGPPLSNGRTKARRGVDPGEYSRDFPVGCSWKSGDLLLGGGTFFLRGSPSRLRARGDTSLRLHEDASRFGGNHRGWRRDGRIQLAGAATGPPA